MMNEHVGPAWKLQRKPHGFLIAAAFCVAGLLMLGTWQLDRLTEKTTLISDRQANLAQPPFKLISGISFGAELTYRRVTVAGRFLHEKELKVGPKSRRGRVGWSVVTPFRHDNGRIVLIDRGWVPSNQKDPESRQAGQIVGAVTLTGFVNKIARRNYFVPDNNAEKGDWYWIDPVAMAAHLELRDVAPYWIVANRNRDRQVGPIGNDRVAMPANNHLQYAVIWFVLAGALSVLTYAYWRKASSGASRAIY